MAGMDGKAPLLLASVLFAVGAAGLVFTSAERADWGPFRGHERPPRVVVYDAGRPFAEPPALEEFRSAPVVATLEAEQEILAADPQLPPPGTADPEPTPAPIPPLRVHGISSDSGVSAAVATATPPPIVIGGVAADDAEGTATPAPEPTPEGEPPAE